MPFVYLMVSLNYHEPLFSHSPTPICRLYSRHVVLGPHTSLPSAHPGSHFSQISTEHMSASPSILCSNITFQETLSKPHYIKLEIIPTFHVSLCDFVFCATPNHHRMYMYFTYLVYLTHVRLILRFCFAHFYIPNTKYKCLLFHFNTSSGTTQFLPDPNLMDHGQSHPEDKDMYSTRS